RWQSPQKRGDIPGPYRAATWDEPGPLMSEEDSNEPVADERGGEVQEAGRGANRGAAAVVGPPGCRVPRGRAVLRRPQAAHAARGGATGGAPADVLLRRHQRRHRQPRPDDGLRYRRQRPGLRIQPRGVERLVPADELRPGGLPPGQRGTGWLG